MLYNRKEESPDLTMNEASLSAFRIGEVDSPDSYSMLECIATTQLVYMETTENGSVSLEKGLTAS